MILLKSRNYLAIILLIIFIQSCDQNGVTTIGDKNYPTTYKKTDATTLNQMRRDFAKTNPFISSSITDFGFCGYTQDYITTPWPSRIPDLTKTEAINATKLFISQNTALLGVKSTDNITFYRVDSFTIFEGSIKWYLYSDTQKIGDLEVYDTYLRFSLTNGKMTSSDGNWYPYIYIPAKISVNEEKAKSILLNKVVYLSDLSGRPIPMTITAKSLETARFSKLIYPLKTTDKIELRVVWVVNIPEVFYVIYLDVMTGEMVGGYPTVIS
jgi:hypothetical protein